ncbi:MAG: molybdopterin biosynthesis protein [Planctomycetaceae bacterium]|nr:molybdopterin biosynthesis protein [Planctomycetaceae bacterium]
MVQQEQFLDVIDRDEAERRFHGALRLEPLEIESIALSDGWGRVLAEDVVSQVDVPSFDRSNYDGFAVQSSDTVGAHEESPQRVRLLPEVIATAVIPTSEVRTGTAVSIATGGVVPRGADAVVMVEHADLDGAELLIRRSVAPGFGIAFAGTDIASGETVMRRGQLLTSRDTGVLAAIGASRIPVWRRPRVAIVSTGDEIISPEQPMQPGMIYDSNAQIIADAVHELGGEPIVMGIVKDDLQPLRQKVREALQRCDIVLLSGGTSKGAGDLSYRTVEELSDPGIVAHGVALKPGKPICLAVSRGKPVVILPGFPTSAIFTFHEFVAPVIRRLAGRPRTQSGVVDARLAMKVNSEIGRTEYLLVNLCERHATTPPAQRSSGAQTLVAYPMGKGSGSVTAFSRADGFVTIGRHEEILEAGAPVQVTLLGRDLEIADLVVIGSHCVGLDFLLGRLRDQGFHTKFLAVGSSGGLDAAKRGECDLAGVHLLDPDTGTYNRPFLGPGLALIRGYGRLQGLVFRPNDSRFDGRSYEDVANYVRQADDCLMVNRNQGSGTRILIDQLLDGAKPAGYAVQSRSHNAVAAAIAQGRADWGVAIRTVADAAGLAFLALSEEQFDLVVPDTHLTKPAVRALQDLLINPEIRQRLVEMGFAPAPLQEP